MNLDKANVSKIFHILKDGKFLCQNSPKKEEVALFEYLSRHYEELREYFSYIDIDLKLQSGFCYFSSMSNKEQKLNSILELVDIVSFLFEITPSFDVGYRFFQSDLSHAIKDDAVLLKKLHKIKSLNTNADTLEAKLTTLIQKLEKKGFVALENEYMDMYVVLNSFEYLISFFNKVEIQE